MCMRSLGTQTHVVHQRSLPVCRASSNILSISWALDNALTCGKNGTNIHHVVTRTKKEKKRLSCSSVNEPTGEWWLEMCGRHSQQRWKSPRCFFYISLLVEFFCCRARSLLRRHSPITWYHHCVFCVCLAFVSACVPSFWTLYFAFPAPKETTFTVCAVIFRRVSNFFKHQPTWLAVARLLILLNVFV
jgi:hypothetical protein